MDIEKIEQLVKQTYHDAEITPPADAWDKISQRMAAQPATPQPKSHKALWWSLGAASALSLAIALVTFLPNRSNPLPSSAEHVIASLPAEEIQHPSSSQSETSAESASQIVPTDTPKESTTEAPSPAVTIAPTITSPEPSSKPTPQPKPQQLTQPQQTITVPQTTATPKTIAAPENTKASEKSSPSPKQTPAAAAPQPLTASTGNATTSSPEKKQPSNESPAPTPNTNLNIVIPNLISPNYDGVNDCWIINDLSSYADVHVQIFTAKSKKIYENSHYSNQFCGDDLPDGQYFYVIQVRSINFSRRGVLIIRR